MKNAFLLMSMGILFTVLGCAGNSEKGAAKTAPTVVQASVAPAGSSLTEAPAAALPVPSVAQVNQQAWHSENVQDRLGNAIAVKGTSLDGKFDLVILQKGRHS